ncbi:SGNH/GDSL hydrolase family protein [Paraburkholderia sp. 2C]
MHARIMFALNNNKAMRMAYRGIVASFLGAIIVACSGCGGGGGGADISSAGAAPPVPKSVLIETYGDSTTAGNELIDGVYVNTQNSEPAVLQRLLQAQLGPSVTVSNQGVGGTEASQLLNGTDGVHPTWANQMAMSKAAIVTLNFGLNDAYYSQVPTTGFPAESPSDFANAVTQLVQIATTMGKKVVIFEPNPTCVPVRANVLGAYVQALQGVASAQNVPIVNEYSAIEAMPNWQSMLTDCLHPGDALYAAKAQMEAPIVAEIAKTLQ